MSSAESQIESPHSSRASVRGKQLCQQGKKLGFILKFGNCREDFYLGITTMQFAFQKDHSGKKEESSGGL